jgi:hypothetical protein
MKLAHAAGAGLTYTGSAGGTLDIAGSGTTAGRYRVVSEPGAIALAGVGIALVCWTAARRTCRSAR